MNITYRLERCEGEGNWKTLFEWVGKDNTIRKMNLIHKSNSKNGIHHAMRVVKVTEEIISGV